MSYQHQTSGVAYKDLKPQLGQKQSEVFEVIKTLCSLYRSCNDRMIRDYFDERNDSAALNAKSRRNELAIKGFIVEAGKKVDPITNKKSIYWKVKDNQLTIF